MSIRSSDAPKTEFIEWVRAVLNHTENQAGIFFDISSDSIFATEFVARLKSSFVKMPSSFWRIEYSKSDIANARLLHLWSRSYTADLARPPSLNDIEIARKSSLKAPREFGAISPFSSVVVANETLKERLDLKNLKGLTWVECRPRNRKPEHQSVWRVSSEYTMPKTAIPLIQSNGEPFDGDYDKGCQYKSRYTEVELAYMAQSIESMDDFDVALTHEMTGNYPGTYFQSLVVTQDFRRALESEKVKGVKYTPVRILQPGDPVIRDPFAALASGCKESI
jgi:hypothetical protein